MKIEFLTALYFVFFLATNIMFFQIADKIMDKSKFPKKTLYVTAIINSIFFSIMVYGFNQLPTVTYLIVLIGSIIQLLILFKNSILGVIMCSFMATIYLVCIESIVISSGALILNLSLADITHDHQTLFLHIVISWFLCMVTSICINAFVPGKYFKIINQNREQIIFVLGFLFTAAAYLTLNSFIYANANIFDANYLIIHQIISPITWLVVVNLAVILLIRLDYLHGYKVKTDILQKTIAEQKYQLSETQNRAERDLLVNAYNKVTTKSKIEETLAEGEKGAFFILDIDNFKNINDTKGHPYGDKVLVYLFKRIMHTFRERDIVGRIGGDEFVIFLKNPPDIKIVENKAASLCSDVNIPFTDELGESAIISISIGVALCPEHGEDFDTLYSKADIALYESKNKGKNTFTIHSI